MIQVASSGTDSVKVVSQSLSFQTPDRLPVYENYWPEFIERWQARHGLPAQADIDDHHRVDLCVPYGREEFFPSQMGEVGREGDFVLVNDGWGRVVRTRPGTYFCEPVHRMLADPADLDNIHFESPNLDRRYEHFAQWVDDVRRKRQAVFVKIGGLFIRGSFFRGETEFLMDLAEDEGFAKALVGRMAEYFTAVGLEQLRRADAWDSGLWIFDDMCNLQAPMFSPNTFERIFLPAYQQMIRIFKAAGCRRVILHCDGNLNPLLDLLVEAGFDAINPVEPAAGLDVVKLIPKYRGKLAFIGGVCNTHILPRGDEKEIRRHVEAIVEAGRNGGLVVGTHSVGPDITVESYHLYRRIVAERGNYKQQGA